MCLASETKKNFEVRNNLADQALKLIKLVKFMLKNPSSITFGPTSTSLPEKDFTSEEILIFSIYTITHMYLHVFSSLNNF